MLPHPRFSAQANNKSIAMELLNHSITAGDSAQVDTALLLSNLHLEAVRFGFPHTAQLDHIIRPPADIPLESCRSFAAGAVA